MRRVFKKSKKLLGTIKKTSENSKTRASGSTSELLGNTAQNAHSPQGSVSNVSVQSAPSPKIVQAASGPSTGQVQAAQEQSPQRSSTQCNALQTASAVAKESLKMLKELSEFIPVPALGSAIGVVSECIEIYDVSRHSCSVSDWVLMVI